MNVNKEHGNLKGKKAEPLEAPVTTIITNSILDPHLSVLELLERGFQNVHEQDDTIMSTTPRDIAVEMATVRLNSEASGVSTPSVGDIISQSWHTIQRRDLEESLHNNSNKLVLQSATAGILSSSDTSEEEEGYDINGKKNSPLHLQPKRLCEPIIQDICSSHMNVVKRLQSSPVKADSDKICTVSDLNRRVPSNNAMTPDTEEEEEGEDYMTASKSLTSSSTSFIMPRLSLTKKERQQLNANEFRILIVGRLSSKLFKMIPHKFQNLFQLQKSYDINEYQKFTAILVVIQETRELISLLNRISRSEKVKRPLIAICEKDAFLQCKNVLKSYLRNDLITLLYQPFVISNTEELDRMLVFLKETSIKFYEQAYNPKIQIKEKVPNDGNRNAPTSSDLTLSKDRVKNDKHRHTKGDGSGGSKKGNEHDRKPKENEEYNKWIIWGISLSIGVGIGYCISYFGSSPWSSLVQYFNPESDSISATVPVPLSNESFVLLHDSDNDSETKKYFFKSINFLKYSINKVKVIIKDTIRKPLNAFSYLNGLNTDDASSLLALGYILI
ncbi:hypothetical protein KAFR_0D02250 [Kazachstania africana CBS 2517]|uniref:Autophagy-related protein 32 n=1 Tax=Kazachstania africana (strain ATCC 22294 / BCRC 22015 / CBS 2517 / CECT 1963 / NBRC 1671 / NRRL Y-8276) TaxID=1071382 RepID=H2AU22_KAZAF|nr:hypothetical protein KAFR_0D02250 [Kazachstania africana CBS 2517]CCF57872.1 hypothetical protein KAFR_0D02250 [Kazachstania africana CBS 2517]